MNGAFFPVISTRVQSLAQPPELVRRKTQRASDTDKSKSPHGLAVSRMTLLSLTLGRTTRYTHATQNPKNVGAPPLSKKLVALGSASARLAV